MKRLTTRQSRQKDSDRKWYIGDNEITVDSKTEHLGIIRNNKSENQQNLEKQITLSRKTLYSLIKTGLHGCNGLNPKVSYKIYQVYVIP